MGLTKSIYSAEYRYLVVQLRKAREQQGLTQKGVAVQLGVTQSLVSKIEGGQYRIDVIQLQKFAKLYGRKINFFLKTD
jgi:transcriptional regulator with XRE-family HTH domain